MQFFRTIPVLAFLMLSLAACTTARVPAPPALQAQLAQLKTEMLTYLSAERARLNDAALPLRLDPVLASAAQTQSDAMAERGAFDEGGADRNAAVQQLAADPSFQGFIGENSAMQYFHSEYGIDPEAYAKSLIDQWIESDDHRENIIRADFDRVGIGVAANEEAIYASVVFARDLRPEAAP